MSEENFIPDDPNAAIRHKDLQDWLDSLLQTVTDEEMRANQLDKIMGRPPIDTPAREIITKPKVQVHVFQTFPASIFVLQGEIKRYVCPYCNIDGFTGCPWEEFCKCWKCGGIVRLTPIPS